MRILNISVLVRRTMQLICSFVKLWNVCRCGDTVMAEPILDYGSVSVADWNDAQIKEEQVRSFGLLPPANEVAGR